ncbi:DUF3048 domain-containing protein [Agromyces intestinalis]|uniref:DUF3048 domain-containing protein n=1 Tax=Agromyces intestinalis TaxID=2592652 RepID=A0A5C1YIH0_9MICO|nr:DUF3048 domain-containing protein [Agromyces intestinalis]QEO15315.1 DUF3048 domain-containing protein [Agromyces intestinalis]
MGRDRGVRRFGAALLICAVGIGLLSCSGPTDPLPTETPTPTRARPASDIVPVPIAYAPLRGTLADGAALAHPSIGVKIDNHEEARPQIALNRSDIAFEELVEGGITRYAVVWHADVPDEVGPVRSIRPMDPDILTPFGGPVAYSGGQDVFVEMMMSTGLPNLVFDYDETGLFYRADDRPGPHDVILLAKEGVGRYLELGPPPTQFVFGGTDPLADPAYAAQPTSHIALVFSDARFPSWDWDAATGAWLRSQEGVPESEASGERVRATNVVTLRVGIDWSWGEVPRTVLDGGGEAWVSAAGRTAHGTWSKASREAPIVLTADDGTPLRLAPGNTWVELVPNEGGVTFAP